MDISFIGHSCFKIAANGASVVIDPYADGSVPGLGPINERADMVLCSHDHHDHNAREKVALTGRTELPFKVETVTSCHDDAGGAKRGPNVIHIIDDGALRLVHMGDQGCPLTAEQLEKIGRADILLVPVGGFFTVDADQAYEIAMQLKASVIIPMHFRSEKFGFDVLGTADPFLARFGSFERAASTCTVTAQEGRRVILMSCVNQLN